MFGYVRVNSSELKVKEYEYYRATYCGLCRSMGKCTGQCSRLALNYDFAFLVLVRMAILGERGELERKRCLAHPLTKRSVMRRNSVLDYSSGAAAILNYHKLCDDISDERGGKRFAARMGKMFFSRARKKALRRGLDELDGKVREGLLRLSECEKSDVISVDTPAALFGEILGEIVSFGMEGGEKRVAYELGCHVGRWIYVADALDDAPDDMKKGRYNPFLKLYGGRLPEGDELYGIDAALKNELFVVEGAVDLIDADSGCAAQDSIIMNIIRNIIYIGMPDKIGKIISDQSRSEEKKGQMDGNE